MKMVRVRGGAIQFLGTKRHHDEWLRDTENYAVKDVSPDGKYLTAIKDPDREIRSIHGAFDNRACNHTIHCNLLSKSGHSNCHKILIDKESIFSHTKWT
nr:acyl-coenzyme A oxidase 3, peroxisomal-like [Ipomoea batatas]